MALKIIKTTDRRLEGMTFDYTIDTLPSEVIINDLKFENFKVQNLGNGNYRIYNYNYIIEVKEV
jgi:hypothetical protein